MAIRRRRRLHHQWQGYFQHPCCDCLTLPVLRVSLLLWGYLPERVFAL